jgi:hypothetical protein
MEESDEGERVMQGSGQEDEMQARRRTRRISAAGLCLLAIPLLRLAWPQALPAERLESGQQATRGNTSQVVISPQDSPSETARQQARRWYLRARVAVKQELDAIAEWDPDSLIGSAAGVYRRQLMAQNIDLQRARIAALKAAELARTLDETYRATRLLACIECELGHHRAELQHAQRLMTLAPRNIDSLLALQRAIQCNRPPVLEQQPQSALNAYPDDPHLR